VLLWWTFRHQSLSVIVAHIHEANLWLLLAAVAVATATFPIRAIRWRFLLRINGAELPVAPLWHATAIGFMANNLLPARAGEVARAVAVAQMTSVRFTAALASIGVERIMDGLAMTVLMALGIAAGGFADASDAAHLVRVAELAGLAFVAAMVTLVAIVHWPQGTRSIVRKLAGAVLPQAWAAKVLDVFDGLVAGLDVLRSPARLVVAAFWSFAVWTTYATSFWLCFRAFGLTVPWGGALLLQALIGFGVAIPAAPGFWGVWEAVTVLTLNLYGIPDDGAVSFAVAYHIGTFIPITVLGLWSLSRAHLEFGDLGRGKQDGGGRPSGPSNRMTAARPRLQ
jgi:uncharacterized protein (TIRG00374 family)